jgi:hypothetical protein
VVVVTLVEAVDVATVVKRRFCCARSAGTVHHIRCNRPLSGKPGNRGILTREAPDTMQVLAHYVKCCWEKAFQRMEIV